MNYPIETDVPVPTTRSTYAWERMESGSSIVVPRTAINSARGSAKAFVAAHREGWKVITRRLTAEEATARGQEGQELNRIWLLDPTASE